MKLKLIFSLIIIQIGFSQNLKYKYIDDFLKNNVLNDDHHLFSAAIYNGQLRKLNDFENKILKSKDTTKILYFYNNLIFTFCLNRDNETSKEYVLKAENILKKHPDKRELGLFYFTKSYLYHFGPSKELKIKNYLKSINLLEKYGTKEDLVNPYMYIAQIYLDNQQYHYSIKYCLRLKKIFKTKPVIKFDPNIIDALLFENYLKIDKVDSAKIFIPNFMKNNLVKFRNQRLFTKKYNLYGTYLLKTKNYKLAEVYFKKSDSIFRENYVIDKYDLIVNNSTIIKYYNKEKESNIKYKQQIMVVYAIFILIFIILMYFYFKLKTNKTLTKKNKELDELNKQLSAAIENKNDFIDTITHEIKTPIYTIKNINYLLEQNKDLLTINEYLETLNFSSEYLNNLINNFVQHNMSKNLNKENDMLLFNKTNLKKLITQIFRFYILEKKNNNQYLLNFDERINFLIFADDIKLTQIIVNLLNNSTKFTKDGQIVLNVEMLDLTDTETTINFTVKDTGIGIEKDMLIEVFKPFKQESDEINYSYGGVGLGLSIVKSMVELMGGNVMLDSEKAKGTAINFVLKFTITKQTEKFDKELVQTQKKILLVEDNKINQVLTKKIILNNGHLCDVANDGLEAVNLSQVNDYDVIFMDIMMPIMDGYEATQKIRSFKPNIPIIALTSLSENLNPGKIHQIKFDKFLTKPIAPDKINEAILEF